MVGRTPRCSRINTFKPKCPQVEFIDENVDHSDWIFFGYVIVQALRQQSYLRPGLTFNKSLHDRPRYDLDDQKIRQLREFSHSLDPKLTVTKGRNRLSSSPMFFRNQLLLTPPQLAMNIQ
ncbi:hypothetical protein PS704_04492 [Pseudomonas fluorescens]|uniref:Uncharacterized protein n=1 Tax=Pseudomonas fluorescens TaxID=294 RepID=A0A5E7ECM1_PSEFL|nr:hypothetical protein PS704_04492 [Pseudomonas fluorescens]